METKVRIVRLHVPRVRRCYVRQLQREPGLAGTAELHFTLMPDGSVTDVSLDGSLGNEEVEQCIAKEAMTWQFGLGTLRTRVNYPFRFSRGADVSRTKHHHGLAQY